MRYSAGILIFVLSRIVLAQEFTMDFEGWRNLSDEERGRISTNWTPYNTEEVQPLIDQIIVAFRKAYPDYEVPGLGNVHGSLMLVVMRPFIFDKREAPDSYLGLNIRYTLREPVPEGFEVFTRYVWAPENYLAYVDTHSDEIRVALNNQDMSKEELLDALVGMRFDDWIIQCQEWGYTNMSRGDRIVPEKPWWKVW